LYKYIKYLLVCSISIIVTVNLAVFSLATIKKEDYKLVYKKLFSLMIKEPKLELKPPAVFIPKRLGILKPNQLLHSILFETALSLEEVQDLEIRKITKFMIGPDRFLDSLMKDDEWQPLPDSGDGIEHQLDWQFPEWETHLRIYGRQIIGFSYGWSHFLKKPKYAEATATSSAITRGFKPSQSLEIHIKGKVGKKVTIDIDSSGRQESDTYKVEYNALKQDEFIQNITAGNIGVSIPGSSYAVGSSGGTKNAFGIKALAQKGKWKFQAIASMTRGITEVKHFQGTSQLVVKNIKDYDFVKKKYYVINNGKTIQNGSLIIYLDDNNKDNNFGTIPITLIKSNQSETNDCDLLYSGTDYIADYSRGLVIFKRNISDAEDIIVTYNQVDGQNNLYIDPIVPASSDYSAIMTNQSDNKKYVFLSRKNSVSPYEYKGVYYLGNQNIQKKDKDFKFFILDADYRKIDKQPFSEIDTETYNAGGFEYYIDEAKGYVIFNAARPFEFTGSYYISNPDKSIYGLNPNYEDSYYYLHLEYRYEARDFSLHWDIIPDSEKVFLNSRKLTKNKDYTIDYKTGHLEFASSVTITPDSEIDIVYEYLPFGGGLQQILAGLRVDCDLTDWLTLGSVGFYNGKQAPAKVPTPDAASDSRWVGSIFGSATFDQKKTAQALDFIIPGDADKAIEEKIPFTLSFGGEYAGSYHNINTFGQAMIDDFEGTIDTYSYAMKDYDWYICAARTPAEWSTRAKLFYKDYHDYSEDEILRPLGWSGAKTNLLYTTKPGPYNVNEGHLEQGQLSSVDAVQRSLVFDYDFSGGKTWAGVIRKDAFPAGGKDFRDYTDLVMWVKLESDDPTASVKLRVDTGVFSEDIDGDGFLDEEVSKNDGGFLFDGILNTTDLHTAVGGGPKYVNSEGDYLLANGILDSEDMDNNGYLDSVVNEEVLSWPSGTAQTYAITEDSKNDLIISKGNWRLVRVTLSKDALNTEQSELLRRIKHVRIIIETNEGAVGKLLINQIYFAGLVWKDKKLNDQTSTFSNQQNFKVYVISTFDDAEYKENSLRKNDDEYYDDMHGAVTSEESSQESEQALVLEYKDLKKHDFSMSIASNYQNDGQYSAVYVSRSYNNPMDIRYYEKIKFWAYVPKTAVTSGEYLFLRFGGVNNYYEFRKKIDSSWIGWRKIEIDLRSPEFKALKPRENSEGLYPENGNFRVVNIPNLKQVNHISIGIYGSPTQDGATGRIWFNDLHLDDIQKLKDIAYSYNINFNLLQHLNLSYSHSFKGKDFSAIGGLGTGTESISDSVSGSWSTINWLPVNGSWSRSISESDSDDIFVPINEQGFSISKNLSGGVGVNLPSNPLLKRLYPEYWPSVNLSGSISVSSNRKPLAWLEEDDYKTTHFSESYSYAWNGSTKVPLFDTLLKSSVNFQLGRSHSYSESQSFSYTPNYTNLTGYDVSTNYNYSQSIAWNTGGSYSTGDFSVTPRYSYSYSLSKTDPITNVWDLNARSRNFSTGLNLPKVLIKPTISYNLGYSESGFHYNGPRMKFGIDEFDLDSNLYKNASTSQSYSLGIGSFNINEFIFKSFTPSYSQNMGFSQSDISMKSNTMIGTWNKFTDSFLLQIPGNYFYIPYINPHFNSLEFVRQFRGEEDPKNSNTSLSLGNSFSAWLGLDFWEISQWSLSYSLSQNTSRSYSSYSLSHSWSVSGSSSLNLMNIFNFWIWRQNKDDYTKSSAFSYGASFRKTNGFLQKSIQYSFAPNISFSYRWKADKSIGWSLSYSYSIDSFDEHKTFYEIVEQDFGKEFRNEIEPNTEEYPDKKSYAWSFKTSYSFSTDLKEYWKPPLFFKKPIKLGYKINHTIGLGYTRTTYDYGQDDSGKDHIHPKEMVGQASLDHSWTINISKNIDGGGHEKVVYEMSREERGEPGEDNDDLEQILSWELGLNLTIRF